MRHKNTPCAFGPIIVLVAGLAPCVAGSPDAKAGPERRVVAVDDFARIRAVGDPRRSPDGQWVAYSVATVDLEKDTRDTDLWMASWDGAENVRLTFGPDSESSPRWSPDGRCLAFLASRGSEEEKKRGAQVWLLDRRGGEARRLTDIKGGVDDYAWSPDGKRLVLVVSDPDPADEPETLEGWKRKAKPPIVVDRYRFKRDRAGYLRTPSTHLWLFDLEANRAEQLTKGPYADGEPAWSPDGTRIAFVGDRGPDPDRAPNEDVFVIDAKSGAEPRRLTDWFGPDGGRPAWSPDGRHVAFLRGDEPRFSAYNQNALAVVPVDGGEARILTAGLDRPVWGPVAWAPDGLSLVFVVIDDLVSYVGTVPASGGPVKALTSGRRMVMDLSLGADGAATLLAGSATEVPEVHALEPDGTLRRLSRQNDALLSDLRLGTTMDFVSRSKDGTEVHGVLVLPPGAEKGRSLPLILRIHGGPNMQDGHAFSFDRELFAAEGYAVLAVNYRGSSGRGAAFQKAIYGDWGRKEVIDLLGAVDAAVAMGVADPDRLGIGGWSYGGILTNYAIATDPRFKAAISGAGSSLQLSMYGSDQYIRQYEQEIGPPWKVPDRWIRVSYPFFKADRIRTPTLFLGGEKDFNVPIIGGEQMYQALKSLGVETQLIVYPGQFHGITTPSYVKDRYERYLAWYGKHLKGAAS